MAIRRRTPWSSLSSPKLAISLMLYLGVYSFVGTLIPQGASVSTTVVAWARSHQQLEPLVNLAGLHHAYVSVLFLLPTAILAASTVACAWKRTSVAISRFRTLAALRAGDLDAGLPGPSFTIDAENRETPEALAIAEEQIAALGWPAKRSGDGLVAASHPLVAFGSPVFHWSLVALIVVLGLGALYRADGLLGVPVGERVANVPSSYGVLSVGPLHSWSQPPSSISVEKLEPSYVYGGIDRGPTPTVVVRAADGTVLAHQRVYPNSPLRFASTIIHPSDYGLAASFALLSPSGAEKAHSTQLFDFDEAAPAGTTPAEMTLTDSRGQAGLRVDVTVPVSRRRGAVVRLLPRTPVALVRVTGVDGGLVATGTLRPGESLAMPDGTALRLRSVTYYARLNVVDDWTVPPLYAALALALVGVSVALLGSQRALVVTTSPAEAGTTLSVTVRTWRHGGPGRTEIEGVLREALQDRPADGSQG